MTDALLHRAILPQDALAFERVSGAIAVRAALRLLTDEQSLLFAVPEANASTARDIVASLLIGDYAHANAQGSVPQVEERHLLRGDIVLVTRAISNSKARLDELQIGKGQRLADIWEVTTLSRYTATKSAKPKVYLANPGWLEKAKGGRQFGAVVIDASHPSTFAQLPELMRVAAECAPLRVTVSPPPTEAALNLCGQLEKLQIWMWDPQARLDAETVAETAHHESYVTADRYLWVCDSDAEGAKALADVYRWLLASVRAASGGVYPGLRLCWGIYNRLRQVAVPLAQLEQVAASRWAGNIRRRIDELESVSGHGNVAWDTTWPQLVSAIRAAYDTFLRREETAKFWALASNLEAFLASPTQHLRVVVGSEAEVTLLVPALESVLDGFSDALASGSVDFVTGRKEAILVAEGDVCPTILMAPRASGFRYLDVFPSARIDELLYPYEIDLEQGNQARLYATWIPRMTDEARVQFLALYGFRPEMSSLPRVTAEPPAIVIQESNGHQVSLVATAGTSEEIDIDALVGIRDIDLLDDHVSADQAHTANSGAVTEVRFTNGERRQYLGSQKVDIYLSETSSVQRHLARDIHPGWQVITFVDGKYDGLFQRLAVVVNSRLPSSQRVALELWHTAKEHLVALFESKRELYDRLVSKGLTSSYGTFISWFSDGGGDVIAPQHFDEFKVLASEISAYANSKAMMDSAFKAIQHERGRHRSMGRTLRKFLRAVVSGDGYEEALAGARRLDASIADVFAAVEVLEVDQVHEAP